MLYFSTVKTISEMANLISLYKMDDIKVSTALDQTKVMSPRALLRNKIYFISKVVNIVYREVFNTYKHINKIYQAKFF